MADEFDVDLEEPVKVAVMPVLPEDRPAPSLEEYVALQVSITQHQIAAGVVTDDPLGRLARTERYAKWRHAGYLAGHIEGL